jgi:uncharacterized protein YaaR (DUF327 family)
MKISQDLRTQVESALKNSRAQPNNGASFDAIVQSQTHQLKEQELQRLMKNITLQGERLSQFRSFKDLAKFKKLVQDFVKEGVQYGLDLKQSPSWNAKGQSRMLTTVKTIDQKLIELTEAVTEQEKKGIDILGIIGEIKGLLINLYT